MIPQNVNKLAIILKNEFQNIFGTFIRVQLIELLQIDFPYFRLSMLINIIQKYKVNTLELAFYVLILFRSIMLIVLLYGWGNWITFRQSSNKKNKFPKLKF